MSWVVSLTCALDSGKSVASEIILAVDDLAERPGPVHKGIVFGRYEYRFRSKATLASWSDQSGPCG